jgi:hypothetical protein
VKAQNLTAAGSSGLVVSEAVEQFDRQGHAVVGVDNNVRSGRSL